MSITGSVGGSITGAEHRAMTRALTLASTPGVPLGPNPRVGCVVIDATGATIGEGFHRGAGTPHAEVRALAAAGAAATGSTAVVTLEPCNHSGRTGPCTQALIDAGVRRVVFAQPDPNPVAAGGAETLRAAGIEVESGALEDKARDLNRAWSFAMDHGRPYVTWKFASTLDGRCAAADGSSRWISNAAARHDAHRLRSECDAIVVGTGTVERDDPELTVRDEFDEPLPHQPLRVVLGTRTLDATLRVFNARAETQRIESRDVRGALGTLFRLSRHHVFLEGGPTLAAAFLRAGLVDEIVAYVAPMLLGAGAPVVGDLGIDSIAGARHLRIIDVTTVDPHDHAADACVRIRMRAQ